MSAEGPDKDARGVPGEGPTSADSTVGPEDQLGAGRSIGQYTLVRQIASGGMGVVYEARQQHPRRTVAVKLMREGLASPSARRRFEDESQLLARLHHPNIAQIYEAGEHREGLVTVPFFAMEYIPGARSLTDHGAARRLGLSERLELFAKVCDAVHHGHQKGVIHRDLKPGNILVDGSGEPKVIDFGVARAIDADLSPTTLQTRAGQLVGTLLYMSPEQVDADPHDLDVRSDIYALGVVLYEFLTGRLPYDLGVPPHSNAARVIKETPPQRLSAASGDRALCGDIEAIVFKALEKDRRRRYQSARELQQDLLHCLSGEPVSAHPPSFGYQLRVFARRNRRLVAGVVAVFVALVLGVVATSHQARRARQAERTLKGQFEITEREAYAASIAAAAAALADHDVGAARGHLSRAPAALRGWEWLHLASDLDRSRRTIYGHVGDAGPAVFLSGGARMASVDDTGTLAVWDASSGRETATLSGFRNGPQGVIDVSPDGGWLAALTAAGQPVLIDAAAGTRRDLPEAGSGYDAVRFVPGRPRLALFGSESRVIDLDTGRVAHSLTRRSERLTAGAFGPDGRRLVAAAMDGAVRMIDAERGADLWTGRVPIRFLWSAAFSPDGTRVAVASVIEPAVYVLDARDGSVLVSLSGHAGGVKDVSFSPRGDRLVTAGTDGTARIWDARSGALVTAFHGHGAKVHSARFDPDGRTLLTGGGDGTLKIWDLAPPATRPSSPPSGLSAGSLGPDGAWYAGFDREGTLKVFRLGDGKEVWTRRSSEGARRERGLLFSRDSDLLAFGKGEDGITIAAVENGALQRVLTGFSGHLGACAFGPDAARLACGAPDRTVQVWDATSGERLAALEGHAARPRAAAFSPSGNLLATGDELGGILVWRVPSTRPLLRLPGAGAPVHDLEFVGGESRLAALVGASRTGTGIETGAGVALWDLDTRALIARNIVDEEYATAPLFNADASGSTLVLFRLQRPEIPLVHLPSCRRLLTLPTGLVADVESAVFAGPARAPRLVAAGLRGGTESWDPSRGLAFAASLAAEPVAGRLVAERLAQSAGIVDVIRGLRDDERLDPAVRDAALRTALRETSSLDALAGECRRIAHVAGRSPAEYEAALARAELAVRFLPEVDRYRRALGATQYRAGRFEDALESFRRGRELAGKDEPAALAFEAMALARLGRADGAARQLEALRRLLAGTPALRGPTTDALLRESTALVEGSPATP